VRQNGVALRFAEDSLRGSPLLQPRSVARNCLAGPGCLAPVAFVSALVEKPDHSVKCRVTLGFGGSEGSFVCGARKNLGDLARAVVRRNSVEGGLVHVTLPSGARCSPLEAHSLLAALAPVAPAS